MKSASFDTIESVIPGGSWGTISVASRAFTSSMISTVLVFATFTMPMPMVGLRLKRASWR